MSSFKAETESLLGWLKFEKPESEERLSGVFGWQLCSYIEAIGLQYRLPNATQYLSHGFFLVTVVEITR
ncbi:hypothetical protein ES676_06680 [Bizionia saleffrena]|uniref:Uncharacterized protein n=1 Tax=Bizionia saleffrena TaxID=291189 RepID=A0A8H2LFU9_9FLAO|nr:hypothetical protein [Bizionia saleffrena]TYB76133.1 hypothetical protein ES676_06680 [Bizionia saleffrena]